MCYFNKTNPWTNAAETETPTLHCTTLKGPLVVLLLLFFLDSASHSAHTPTTHISAVQTGNKNIFYWEVT